MLVSSDNGAANELEHWLGGSYRVDETIRALGLTNTVMYGGYETDRRPQGAGGVPIPIRTEEQPSFPIGKYTTAWDLARLLREVWLAAGTRSSFPGVVTAPGGSTELKKLSVRGTSSGCTRSARRFPSSSSGACPKICKTVGLA